MQEEADQQAGAGKYDHTFGFIQFLKVRIFQ
jgi:hypothetical protein